MRRCEVYSYLHYICRNKCINVITGHVDDMYSSLHWNLALSGKTSITLNALLLLEHAAGHHSAGETEHAESYRWGGIVVLQSSPTVGAVITEIQAWDCIKNWLGPHPTRSSYSSLYLALHFWHQPYITSTGSFAFKHEPVQVTVEFVPLTLSSSVHSHLAEILLQ